MRGFSAKTKDFLKKHRKQILELLAMLAILVVISVITFLVLLTFNVVYFEDGMKFNTELFHAFRTSWYGWIIFILLHTGLSILLCAMPGASMAFIILAQTIYTVPWQAFLLSFASVMISSTAMYIVGRFGGYKICARLLGEEDCAKALGLLRDKGTVFFPLMMMFPVFPDDALVMIAGTIKMHLGWFIPSIVIGRGMGIATITFGLSLIPFEKFTTAWHWICFIIACAVAVLVVFSAAIKLNKYMENRRKMHANDSTHKNEDSYSR